MLGSNLSTIAVILAAMTLVALLETVIPLHTRTRRHRAHLAPNLALTFITFATNLFLNIALLLLLLRLQKTGFGMLRWLGLGPVAAGIIAIVVLDFSYYLAHVAMHKVPVFWRVHRVHHSDPVVDVTTTIRQHPLESLIRYGFIATSACVLGAGLGAFAIYQAWSALGALLEHANVRVPRWLDTGLSFVTTWPNMHKVHHSRDARETDTNYGNIFSWFDRLFATFTRPSRGESVVCGLDGFDELEMQTTAGLLAIPFREDRPLLGRDLQIVE